MNAQTPALLVVTRQTLYLLICMRRRPTVLLITMGRKSKQAGTGHLPLTNHEIKTYSKEDAYGTTSVRLSRASQLRFGDCALSLHPAKDQPVATPSGNIYERPGILTYLLTKTQELKQQQKEYDQWKLKRDRAEERSEEKKRSAEIAGFESTQLVIKDATLKKQKEANAIAKATENSLKTTSYWLTDSQPAKSANVDGDDAIGEDRREPPPKRPPSPNSGQPLRRKDLIDLELKRNSDDQVICAVSEKSITTQPALALITTKPSSSTSAASAKPPQPAHVVLEQVYNDLGKERACPVTGRKVIKIIQLQKGGSAFASKDGVIEAKRYLPTMT